MTEETKNKEIALTEPSWEIYRALRGLQTLVGNEATPIGAVMAYLKMAGDLYGVEVMRKALDDYGYGEFAGLVR